MRGIKMKIELPLKVSTNKIYSGMHWRNRAKHKELMLTACIGMKTMLKYEDMIDLRIDFFFKGKLLDSSNCSYMGKMIEDCLVKYGVLIDDTPKYVRDFTISSNKGQSDYAVISIKLTK